MDERAPSYTSMARLLGLCHIMPGVDILPGLRVGVWFSSVVLNLQPMGPCCLVPGAPHRSINVSAREQWQH